MRSETGRNRRRFKGGLLAILVMAMLPNTGCQQIMSLIKAVVGLVGQARSGGGGGGGLGARGLRSVSPNTGGSNTDFRSLSYRDTFGEATNRGAMGLATEQALPYE